MRRVREGFLALGLLGMLAGCASLPPPVRRAPEPRASEGEAPATEAGPAAEPAPPPPPRRAIRPEGGATVALLADADALERSGELDRAAAVLERALRITPDDPLLWHRLAAVRLRQGRADQAEQLARKSSLLATGDPTLQARNWRVVAGARRARGDEAGARIAEGRAAELAPGARP